MIVESVIMSPHFDCQRQVMDEIHGLSMAGRRGELLLVLPNIHSVFSWQRAWEAAYPYMPMVRYVYIDNILPVRGLRLSKLFVEDIDAYPEGIYDPRLAALKLLLYTPLGDEEVIYTSSHRTLNMRSHSEIHRPEDVLSRYLQARR